MNEVNEPADWRTWPVAGSAETLLLLADETAAPGTAWLSLPGRPGLHRDAEGRPVLGLTLVLSRHPEPDEPIADLVELGHFAFEMSLAASAELVGAAAAELHARIRPLFANSVTATLEPALVTARGAGADAVIALSATLSREHALAVLTAFRGNPSDVLVRAHVECVTAVRQREVHLRGRWLDVHTRLAAVAGLDGRIGGVAVRAVLAELLADRTVLVSVDDVDLPDGLPPDRSEAAMAVFVKAAGFLLRRETTDQYILRQPPNPSFPLDVRMTTQLPGSARAELTASLEQLLGGVLDGLDADRYIRTVVPDNGSDAQSRTEPEHAPFSVRRPPPPPDGELEWPPLPVYTGPAPYWEDGARPGTLWYAPEFTQLPVTADGPPGASGFLFSFTRTESPSGPPRFAGRVRFRLRSAMSAATKQALKAISATAKPVPMEKLAVYLEIPFRDNLTGQTRTQLFTAVLSVDQDCVIVADFDLLDDWVRLAYGALSTPGFQTRPVRLQVVYWFRACWLSDPDAMAMAMAFAPIRPGPTVVEGSVPSNQLTPVSYPCATFPELYRQQFPDGERSIGCQDVLRLGEVAYQQFAEVTALREAFAGRCRIYRSLLQPGLFLIVPARYRITRHGQTEPPERAFRPDVLIYAVFQENPADNRYLVTATLQPDLSPDLRRDLETRLVAYSPNGFAPRLVMPTDAAVGATDRFVWAPGISTDQPQVRRAWDSLQVTLSTGLANAVLVTRMIEGSGYSGTVTFTLPDGLKVDAHLLLDSYVAGPWDTGPVTLELTATAAKLTNRIERTVTVPELLVAKTGVAATVPVATSLAAGGTTTVTLPAGVTGVWPRCTPAGGPLTIEELDVFVEDVTADLIFVDLIAHATHGLALLHVDVRIHGRDAIQGSADLTAPNTPVRLTLPVTSYLQTNSVQFRFTRRMTDGSTVTGAWLAWNMSSQGNVISVTWAMVSTGQISNTGRK